MELGVARIEEILRRDAHWNFGIEVHEDGDWAVLAVPVHAADATAEEVFHVLALTAVTMDHHGSITDGNEVLFDEMLNDFLDGEA